MLISEIDYGDGLPVQGYGPGFFRVAGSLHHGPLALQGAQVRPWGGWEDHAFHGIDVLIVGSGAATVPAPPTFRAAIEALEVGFEVMTTPAACRAYNMLLAESRRVALAAFPL